MSRLKVTLITLVLVLSSCSAEKRLSEALLLSANASTNARNNTCRTQQLDYIKQKIGPNAPSLSVDQLLEEIFMQEEDFFKEMPLCGAKKNA